MSGMLGNIALPWWKALKLRDEILSASGTVKDVQMSLYRVAFDRGANQPKYAKPDYYGQITHPTVQLTDLLARVAILLADPSIDVGKHVIRLGQSMGGGKSHACIGAYHLAKSPQEFAKTDIGREVLQNIHDRLGRDLPTDLKKPHVVVLSCDNMTPGVTVPEEDGPVAISLYQRFLYRLVDGDLQAYAAFEPSFASKADISRAIQSVGRPVLIIIDELLNYIGQALDGAEPKSPGLTGQDMAFLSALPEAVDTTPGAAMIAVMISSEQDATALSPAAEERRNQMERHLRRNGDSHAVTESADFAAILRRRLFDKEPDPNVVVATANAFLPTLTDSIWRSKVFEPLGAAWTNTFRDQVERCYPFHPQLMAMAEQEWANLAGFQKVRSTIKIFAAAIYALQRRAETEDSVPALIGIGDIPLSDNTSREALLDSGLIGDPKEQANYRSLSHNDIVDVAGKSGAARMLDLNRKPSLWTQANPRVAERAATAIFLASIVGLRGHGRQGASDIEVEAALAVPDTIFTVSDSEGVLRELTDNKNGMTTVESKPGRGGQRPSYFMKTGLRLQALVRTMRNTVTDDERDELIAERTDDLIRKGPFDDAKFLGRKTGMCRRDLLANFVIEYDRARTTRFAVLDPAAFTMQNGEEEATRQAIEAAFGLPPHGVTTRWASSLVFAAASTRSRGQMRQFAADYLAYQRVADTTAGQADAGDIPAQAIQERDTAEKNLKTAIKRGFQHVLFLAHPGEFKVCEAIQLRSDTKGDKKSDEKVRTALHGDTVWEELVHHEKALPSGALSGHVLIHHLQDQDYDRPITEVRNGFWNNPRLPLLAGGEGELRQAIYAAFQEHRLRVTWGTGEDVVITAPLDIALANDALRLQRQRPEPEPEDEAPETEHGTDQEPSGESETESGDSADGGKTQEDETPAPPEQKTLGLMFSEFLEGNPNRAAELGSFLREIWVALDKGQASELAVQIHLVASEDVARTLADKGKNLGITVLE